MTRRVKCGSIQREGHMLEVLYAEPFENYLRAAPIRPGPTPLPSNEVILCIQDKQGGTAVFQRSRPWQSFGLSGIFFYAQAQAWKPAADAAPGPRGGQEENHLLLD